MTTATVVEPQTYRQDGEHSYFRDLVLHTLDDDEDAKERLRRHTVDTEHWTGEDQALAQMETRKSCPECGHGIDGVRGSYALPPLWLLQQVPELLTEYRPYLSVMQIQPLPPGTDSINVATRVCTPPRDEILAKDWYISAPVRTFVGQQSNNPKWLRELPTSLDAVIFADLVADYAATTTRMVIQGSGASGQILGIHNTPNIGCHQIPDDNDRAIYNAISDAIGIIEDRRFLPPEHIIMHPDRWKKLSRFDKFGTNRLHDVTVITDKAMPTTIRIGDRVSELIHVARTSDLVMWESSLRCRVLPHHDDALLQVYGYSAFTASRFPQSIVEIDCPCTTVT